MLFSLPVGCGWFCGWKSVRQGEGDQRAAVAGAEHSGEDALEPAAPADRHDHVLLSVDAVGRAAAVMPAAAVELPQLLAGVGVERGELSGRGACEHQVARGGEYRSGHREVEAPAPLLLTVRVEGTDRTGHVVDVHLNGSTPVRNALLELTATTGGGGAHVGDGHVEHVRLRAVGRVRPLLRTCRAGIEVDRLTLLVRVLARSHLAVSGDDAPVDPVHEGRDVLQ